MHSVRLVTFGDRLFSASRQFDLFKRTVHYQRRIVFDLDRKETIQQEKKHFEGEKHGAFDLERGVFVGFFFCLEEKAKFIDCFYFMYFASSCLSKLADDRASRKRSRTSSISSSSI